MIDRDRARPIFRYARLRQHRPFAAPLLALLHPGQVGETESSILASISVFGPSCRSARPEQSIRQLNEHEGRVDKSADRLQRTLRITG